MLKVIRPLAGHLRHPTTNYLSISWANTRTLSSHTISCRSVRENALYSQLFSNEYRSFSTSALSNAAPQRAVQEPENSNKPKSARVYSWIDAEAESLIAKAYERHLKKQDGHRKESGHGKESYPPSLMVEDLEKIGKPQHYKPQDWVDKVAYGLMRFLRVFTHAFFREKYDHHAVTLETVAAVPGIVGAFHRHLRSLRRMERDHSWIKHLLEESDNERMHLLIFLKVTNPSRLERGIVILAQAAYLTFYSALYLVSGRAAHRLVGYLEEEAHYAYTDYLKALDDGRIENKPAPEIARQYYRLPENANMRQVVACVRADEAMHRDTNHHMANKYKTSDLNSPITPMSKNAIEEEEKMRNAGYDENIQGADAKNTFSKAQVTLSSDEQPIVLDDMGDKKQKAM